MVLYAALIVIGKLYTLGDETRDNEAGQPFPQFSKGPWEEFLIVAHYFGLYWGLIFLNNFNDYVTTAVALNYFFVRHEAQKIKNLNIFCHVLSHNIGTIAWSLFLLPTLLLKLIFGVFDSCLSGK